MSKKNSGLVDNFMGGVEEKFWCEEHSEDNKCGNLSIIYSLNESMASSRKKDKNDINKIIVIIDRVLNEKNIEILNECRDRLISIRVA